VALVIVFCFYLPKKRKEKESDHQIPFQKDHNKLEADQTSNDQVEIDWDEIEKQYSEVKPVIIVKSKPDKNNALSYEESNTVASGSNGSASNDFKQNYAHETIKPNGLNELTIPSGYHILKPDGS
jgi:hypothetical protein